MNRQQHLAKLAASQSDPFDIVVIGGGATGLGAALEAATRGYRVALVEAHDFAKGTSSRSTKLVHGGVRYLAQGNIPLVREALRERGRLCRNAPHLVTPLAFVVPAYHWWAQPYYGLGLKIYDWLAGSLNIGTSQIISHSEVLNRIPTLNPDGLRGGVLYHDGQFDDARLAITLAQTIVDHGGTIANYAAVSKILHHNHRVTGLVVQDLEANQEFTLYAKVVINATGIFADQIRCLDTPDCTAMIAPSQGIHLVLPQSFLPNQSALMVPKTADGRVLFLIPWQGKAILGTTDTPVSRVEIEPRPLAEEVQFLLDHAARYLTAAPGPADVLSTYVGLRPLVKQEGIDKTSSLARDHTLVTSSTGLITIVGGKWTTYRKMGEDAINQAAVIGELDPRPSVTAEMPLHGAPSSPKTLSLGDPLGCYGTDAVKIRALTDSAPQFAQPIHPRLPHIQAQVVWAVQQEMACTLEDVLSRRTRALVLDAKAALEAAPGVVRLMGQLQGRNLPWERSQLEQFSERVHSSLLTPP
jgi:glycerol-3-phosphate dehydrogenase